MGDESIRIESNRLRIDLTLKVVGEDEGGLLVEMEPDPRRYEWREEDGSRVLYDRQTRFIYPEEVVREVLRSMEGLPMYAPPSGIPNAERLLEARGPVIAAGLAGRIEDEPWADPSGDAFAARVGEDVGFAVLCIDLVGSTRLQAENSDAYNRLVPALAREVAEISSVFGGLIIKYTGDGAIVGFPEPGFNVRADMALTRPRR